MTAMVALEKGLPFPDPENRQEKDGEIMIDPSEASPLQTAGGTHPWLGVQGNGFRLNAADKEKHGRFPRFT
jgi:hypothetical protein